MVCGPGEGDRYLPQVLAQWKDIVDDAVICQNNTDEKTKQVIKDSGYWTYDDDREWGIDQPSIKTDLLRRVGKLKPSWVLPLDADEIYDKQFVRESAVSLASQPGHISYNFAFIDLWNDERHHNRRLSFWNVRMFKYDVRLGTAFLSKSLHCGLAPPRFYYAASYAPFLIKHYGLMLPEDRARKVERYKKYDPDAKFKDRRYYDELASTREPETFDEDEWHQLIVEDVKKHFSDPKAINKINKLYAQING